MAAITVTTPNGNRIRTRSSFQYLLVRELYRGNELYEAQIYIRTDSLDRALKVRRKVSGILVFDTLTGNLIP